MVASPPKCSRYSIDGFGKNFHCWVIPVDGLDHAVAYERDFVEDAADESDGRHGQIRLPFANLAKGFSGIFSEQAAAQPEDFEGDRVAFIRALNDERREKREVSSSMCNVDDLSSAGRFPESKDTIEDGRRLAEIFCAKRSAEGLVANPVAGTLIAKHGSPAADGDAITGAGAAEDVGAGSSDNEDTRAAGEGCIEGDFFIAADFDGSSGAAGDNGTHPAIGLRKTETGSADTGCSDLTEIDFADVSDFGKERGKVLLRLLLTDAQRLDAAADGARKNGCFIS
ncbi:MAG TPA: hypothetical protein VMI06_03205 [Terriglobia bacterium]|nr:hypothetical protein [Terriglobia bacterium]